MSRLPDFEGLAMFAKVAEERSFAGAARAIGVSVATVSRAVTLLEERLGGRLFNMTSRRLALTDYGQRLAERASRVYAQAQEAEDFARETSSKPRGLVKLAAPLSFGARWVAPILPAFFNSIRTSPSTCISQTRRPTSSVMGSTRRFASRSWRIHRSSRASSRRFADFLWRPRTTSPDMDVRSTHAISMPTAA